MSSLCNIFIKIASCHNYRNIVTRCKSLLRQFSSLEVHLVLCLLVFYLLFDVYFCSIVALSLLFHSNVLPSRPSGIQCVLYLQFVFRCCVCITPINPLLYASNGRRRTETSPEALRNLTVSPVCAEQNMPSLTFSRYPRQPMGASDFLMTHAKKLAEVVT